MFRFSFILFSCLIFFSCAKQEGEGGLASIEGVIMIQNVNPLLEKVGNLHKATDKKVFISYGNNEFVDNDVSTSPDGKFIFNYLTPGDYSIFAYSDDTTLYNSAENMVVKKQISLKDKKEKGKLDTLIIYKFVDYNDGVASVSGVINQIEYFAGTTIKKDTIFAQNEDVFLQFAENSKILERVRTSFDGSYSFSNLTPGSYKIYVLSDDPYAVEKLVLTSTFVITSSTINKELLPLYISKF
jgi:hypothetical protein